ncbi:MAG TPA: OmpA family protein [Anaeromyxobacter sp.]|nr:OmpA family protein [Anaeromyxobacter sp.]
MTRFTIVASALLFLGGTGCVTTSKYEAKEKEALANETRANEAEEHFQTCDGKRMECESKASDCLANAQTLKDQLDQAQRDLLAVTEERDALKNQTTSLAEEKGAAEAKSQEYESLAGSLQKQIEAGQIEISELQNKMTVKLKDKILFPSGSAKLSRDGKAALEVVAGVFKGLHGKQVVVGGYTDDVPVASGGQFQDNWDLSSARAIAVVRYLAQKGVPPDMLAAAGFSEYRPVAPNDSPANRSQNRRIEIALMANYETQEVEVH